MRVERYRRMQGWIDDGERLALVSVADAVRGRPALDLGVGAGRTAWLLRLLTSDYVGIDWSHEMVAASKERLPELDVRVGDARDLSMFPRDHFALVLFSYNGIDNLDHEGRGRVLSEVTRVLSPSGFFVYSTMSKLGPAYRARPTIGAARRQGEGIGHFAARAISRVAGSAPGHRTRVAAWNAAMGGAVDHADWGTAPLEAVGYQLVHFSTVRAERAALGAVGLRTVQMFTDDGRPLHSDQPGHFWFHVVASKPTGEGNDTVEPESARVSLRAGRRRRAGPA